MRGPEYLLGIDVGSTTVKIALVAPGGLELEYSAYARHNADQAGAVASLLKEVASRYPGLAVRAGFCGSGGGGLAADAGLPFVQEVAATGVAVERLFPTVMTAIELGGQDAKIIFFRKEPSRPGPVVSDMRMNGSCAGGTGAFLDQIAELLHVRIDELEGLAAAGSRVYEISGRCGVFAKTDIQPLLNQGAFRGDIALSSFHAVVKQTLGGLAQGADILSPVLFAGGPCSFNPTLVRVFRERLGLEESDIVVPARPELLVAWGAALALPLLFENQTAEVPVAAVAEAVSRAGRQRKDAASADRPFFANKDERRAFDRAFGLPVFAPSNPEEGTNLRVYLGVDAGSTTTKFVLLDEHGQPQNRFYSANKGDPLGVLKTALIEMRDAYREAGVNLALRGVATTGYGEALFAAAFNADFSTVETVAHAEAARNLRPDVSFILDIGGQDMKAVYLRDGVITGITLNEACSAGCGSFIETYARSLGVPVDQIAPLAFMSRNPSRLGSRCTVFMNSSIITEQKNGRTIEDILAGLCRSIVENVFTKVLRGVRPEALGDVVMVQGGTFRNDAVLRAFQEYYRGTVVRPPYPALMGAIGAALVARREVQRREAGGATFRSSFVNLDSLESLVFRTESDVVCPFCANSCRRTVVYFSTGGAFVTGNRCTRGGVLGNPADGAVRESVRRRVEVTEAIPDTVRMAENLLENRFPVKRLRHPANIRIGIPRVLEFWDSLPYWRAVFESLGFEVVVSGRSTYPMFEAGLKNVPSDTVCFPAKLAHGHVRDLLARGVDRVFMPLMVRVPKRNRSAVGSETCPVLQGYPIVVRHSDDPEGRSGVPLDSPAFHWYDERLRRRQTNRYLGSAFAIPPALARKAIAFGEAAMADVKERLVAAAMETLLLLESSGKGFGVVIAGRPYHADSLVNHDLSRQFTELGVPVLWADALPSIEVTDISRARMETYNPYHTRMIEAAVYVGSHPRLELVQIVSFGCGHDAIISDEMARVLKEGSGKDLLVLKLDEGEARGPLALRVRSFVETVRARRDSSGVDRPDVGSNVIGPRFLRRDRKKRTILVPNLSHAFSYLSCRVFERQGYNLVQLGLAGRGAVELGKRYVHNDICFPAQINIGEILAELETGGHDPARTAVALAKNCVACRAGQYAGLCRLALDAAGYKDVAIVTTGEDEHNSHPGFRLTQAIRLRLAWGLTAIDGLETMRRRIRPYEAHSGESDRAFALHLSRISELVAAGRDILPALDGAVSHFNRIPLTEGARRPRVGIVGEILVNYHPSANCGIEAYLEANGMEVVVPGMINFFRKKNVTDVDMARRGLHHHPLLLGAKAAMTDAVFEYVHERVARRLAGFRYYEEAGTITDVARQVRGLVDSSFHVGEGWLMPGEILEMAEAGVDSFVVLNPFGCLPNHISGRGMIKRLKKIHPRIQILALDYDPDTALANVENRLQMIIMGAKQRAREAGFEKKVYSESKTGS